MHPMPQQHLLLKIQIVARILPDARLERVVGAAHGFGDELLTAALERTARFLAWSGVLEPAGEPQ